jgi:hypothetical protein
VVTNSSTTTPPLLPLPSIPLCQQRLSLLPLLLLRLLLLLVAVGVFRCLLCIILAC